MFGQLLQQSVAAEMRERAPTMFERHQNLAQEVLVYDEQFDLTERYLENNKIFLNKRNERIPLHNCFLYVQ